VSHSVHSVGFVAAPTICKRAGAQTYKGLKGYPRLQRALDDLFAEGARHMNRLIPQSKITMMQRNG
jgi:hypothetical protein